MTALPLRVIMMVLKVSTWVYGQYVYSKREKAADHKGLIKHGTNETEKKRDLMCS